MNIFSPHFYEAWRLSPRLKNFLTQLASPTAALLLAATVLALAGCGLSSPSGPRPPGPPPPAIFPAFGHVVIVVEENHSYSEVIGSSSMPYLNSLASQYGLATQYFANTHPSIGNYFMLTSGQIITNDDSFSGIVSDDNIVRELVAAGKSWKSYAESIPSIGYLGGDAYPYAKRHNILTYYADVANNTAQASNIVPFSQFSSDLTNNHLPDFSFVVPNLLDDAHDPPFAPALSVADKWLQDNMGPLISSPAFQKDGLLIIVFDEANTGDTSHGGGHVAAVIVSPFAKRSFNSTTLYQHQSTLRLMLRALGVPVYPGAAATAPDMDEFF